MCRRPRLPRIRGPFDWTTDHSVSSPWTEAVRRAFRAPARVLRGLGKLLTGVLKGAALGAVVVLVVYGLVYGFWMLVPRSPAEPTSVPDGSFAFAALGDAPYSPVEFELFDVVLDDLAQHELAAVIHVGDIFSEPCRDEAYRRTRDVFDAIPHPVVYTPGDNEWTDCYDGSPETEPYGRLASLRDILFDDPSTSRGGRRIPLEHQGDDPRRGELPENARWIHDDVVFATVHIVGSANATRAFRDGSEAEENEPAVRTEAAARWLRETFDIAERRDARAVVLAWHAHTFFEDPPEAPYRQPFEPFLRTLEEEVAAFDGPVLGIHGDFHEFIVDRPLVDRATGDTLKTFTRLEVPGSPVVGWVKVSVTPGATEPFAFERRVIPYWPW